MHLTRIKITNFRNLISVTSELDPSINVLLGNNGSGKSNFLEAIFVLCLGRSQRSANDATLPTVGADFFRVEGRVSRGDMQMDMSVAMPVGGRKRIQIDGVASKLSDLYREFSVVSSGPEDIQILAGAPSERRNFLDVYLAQNRMDYIQILSDYRRALSQKNAALKNKLDASPFNVILADLGARIMVIRAEFLRQVNELAARGYERIAQTSVLEAHYRPSVVCDCDDGDVTMVRECFEATLYRHAERERVMQTSLVGPHRDDIEFTINSHPARSHGSQGELRTAAIALKLAIFDILKAKRGFTPLLLLDEVFAELDQQRADHLIEMFDSFGQVFITSAVRPPDALASRGLQLCLRNGSLAEVA